MPEFGYRGMNGKRFRAAGNRVAEADALSHNAGPNRRRMEEGMKAKMIYDRFPVTYAIVFDEGDEFTEGMKRFAQEHNLAASRITAIGSFSDVTIGYYDRSRKEFKEIPIQEQVEVLSLLGDVSVEDSRSVVHVHCVIGKSDGTAHGGHVLNAHVWPTLEVIVTEAPAHLKRKHDPSTGLMLIDMDQSTVQKTQTGISPEISDEGEEEIAERTFR